MDKKTIREKLLSAGAKNLQEFGYPGATIKTILVDDLYMEMFDSMLDDNMGHDAQIDEVIQSIKSEIEAHRQEVNERRRV